MIKTGVKCILIVVAAIAFTACDTVDESKQREMSAEFRQRKIKQILPAEILAFAEEEGEKTAERFRAILSKEMLSDSSEFIKPELLLAEAADSTGKALGAELFVLTDRSPASDSLLNEFFEMYDYTYKNAGRADAHVQFFDTNKVLYTVPLEGEKSDSGKNQQFLGVLAIVFPKEAVVKKMYATAK